MIFLAVLTCSFSLCCAGICTDGTKAVVAELLMPFRESGQWHQLPGGLETFSSTSFNNDLNEAVKLLYFIDSLC